MKDVPETDWGTDFQLQGWVSPKPAERHPYTPGPGIPAGIQLSLGDKLAKPVPNLSDYQNFPPTHFPFGKQSPNVQVGRKHATVMLGQARGCGVASVLFQHPL